HSGGSDRRLYDGQFQVFSRRYKVIRYDLRGAGKSEVPQILYSNTEDLYALLRFLKVDKAYVLGLSRGGGVAIDFTLEHPEMVDALIMVSSGGGTRPIAQASQQMISAAIKAGREEGIARAVQIWLDDPYQGVERSNTTARQRMKEILTENLPLFLYFWDSPVFRAGRVRKTEQRLSEIRVPTLIIGGQRDDPEARLNRDDMEKSIPGAKKIVFPGLPHLVNLYNPEEFNRVVLEFLSNF
ncbi:MAG: alpha/beta hydrolase, partial [Acidobacteria bacterium]|nr:alpha/beta hydrolase [Acidobacteriota bacterium]